MTVASPFILSATKTVGGSAPVLTGQKTYTHDELNRRTCVIPPVGNPTYYAYDAVGNRTAVATPAPSSAPSAYSAYSVASYYAYDALNRQTCVTDPLDGHTYFAYDAYGNRTQIKDALGQATDYEYDALNRVSSVTDALLQSEYYTYDAVGNMTAHKNAEGDGTYRTFDAINRCTGVGYPDGVNNYYTYDAVSNLIVTRDERGWTYFTYDANNRITQEKQPNTSHVTHFYNALGQRIRVASEGGSPYYVYDAAGRMIRIQDMALLGYGLQPYGTSPYGGVAGIGATYYLYDANGRMTQRKLGNGCYADFVYDAAGRVTSIFHRLSGGGTLAYFGYDHDGNSRITSIKRETGDTIYYAYDDADRLTGETWKDAADSTIYAFAWDYDAVGNRTYEDRDGDKTYYEYDAANALERTHELAGDTWSYFAYDARGNCARIEEPGGTTYFEYSGDNLVTQIKYTDATMNYFYYDAQQRRYAIQDSDGLAYFVWDKNSMNLLAERDATGAAISQYTHGHTPIDGIGSMVSATQDVGGTAYYQYTIYDQRGTVHNIVDATGTTTDTYKYDAWGRVIQEEISALKNRYRYQSNWITLKDSDGKICLSPTRLYHTDLGRFLQRDPIGIRGGLNLYRAYFVPGGTDPRGLDGDLRPATEDDVRQYFGRAVGLFDYYYLEMYLGRESQFKLILNIEDPSTGTERNAMGYFYGTGPREYYPILVVSGPDEPIDLVVFRRNEETVSLAEFLGLVFWDSPKVTPDPMLPPHYVPGESRNVLWSEEIPYSPFRYNPPVDSEENIRAEARKLINDYFDQYTDTIAYRVMNAEKLRGKLIRAIDTHAISYTSTYKPPAFGKDLFYIPLRRIYYNPRGVADNLIEELVHATVFEENWFEGAQNRVLGFVRTTQHERIAQAVKKQLGFMEGMAGMERDAIRKKRSSQDISDSWKAKIPSWRHVFFPDDDRKYGTTDYSIAVVERKIGFNLNCKAMAAEFNKKFNLTGTDCELKCDYGDGNPSLVCPGNLE